VHQTHSSLYRRRANCGESPTVVAQLLFDFGSGHGENYSLFSDRIGVSGTLEIVLLFVCEIESRRIR
jgi:hypothetical protein